MRGALGAEPVGLLGLAAQRLDDHRAVEGLVGDLADLGPQRLGVGHQRRCEPLVGEVGDHHHDVVLVPHGYHGPCIAAPGYPMYYLNVMAGPADERALAFCDDPTHGWVRDSWAEQTPDPRCPMTGGD